MAGTYVARVLSADAGTGEYVLSVDTSRLTVTVPADAAEDGGAVTGTVVISCLRLAT